MDEISILNELKGLILIKTGIRTVTPADCKRISIEISRTLNKNVSETTIKRLFGFAEVKHNFSKFTITTLSEYVSGENIESGGAGTNIIPASWIDVKRKVFKITDLALKGIKNRSGMPYDMTIGRKFAEYDFDEFFQSDHSFTAFIAQPGYGKTILLSHLAESFARNSTSTYRDSAILFLQAYSFFNLENPTFNFEDLLKAVLNIPKRDSLMTYIEDNYKKSKGKLVIILDSFSELPLKKESMKQLFESIINFICAIEHMNSIKLVISMRSATWSCFYDLFRHSAYLKAKWFPGNYFNINEPSNVPPLTEKEIDLIISKIDGLNTKEINPNLKAQLKFPFHIQLYHQLKEEDPTFNYSTNITFHELASRFIQENIYSSNYYTEKILFLKKIIQLTDYGKNGISIQKDSLIGELSTFKNAYTELLSDGIIMEEKRYEDFHPREFVLFIHPHIFEYFLFVELLEKFNLQVDEKFFSYIQTEYENVGLRFQLLQWAVRFVIRIGDFKVLDCIFDFPLCHSEHNYLTLFIAENLKYRSKYSGDTISLLKTHKIHERIIEDMKHFDFVNSSYKETIEVAIDISDSSEHTLLYQSLLTLMDVVSLNQKKIHKRMMILNRMNCSTWELSPHEILQLIYLKITNNPSDLNDLLEDVESLQYPFGEHKKPLTTKQGVTYFLNILLNMFYGADERNIELLEKIINAHPEEFSRRSVFSILMMNFLTLQLSRFRPGQKTDKLERILIRIHENKERFRISQQSEAIFKMTQAFQLRNKGKNVLAAEKCQECIGFFKENNLNLNCILIYDLMINIYTDLENVAKLNEYKYERLCFMEEHNISKNIFSISKEPIGIKHS
ncbi:MAG: NACHT domain-containing protein [Pedobacter sp.]|uniref:NACHT domain-containing protein n=1 Tax=Pedobacter sp. TaxID=1411316 RepID=UPI003563116F